ncbi:MAG: PepSY domain-containing protein [Alteromonadaceae bacterium]|nr:PepSY domain-containing protein [Alteromonadaceae bacterium]
MLQNKLKKQKPLHQRLIRHLREWHRKLGIITAIFIIFLAVTGMMINHANGLSLDTLSVKTPWLLNYYGIKSPNDVRFYADKKISITDNYVWLNDKLLFESSTPVISAAKFQQFYIIVNSDQISLYSHQGELVDQLDSTSGVPINISKIAVKNQHFMVKAADNIMQIDSDFVIWQIIQDNNIQWIKAEDANKSEIKTAIAQFKGQFLSWEQVLLDAHSGRIFSKTGVFASDIVALLLIMLSLSGLYIWLRYANNKR